MKSTLKKWLLPVLASRPVASLAIRHFGYGIPIFMLHRISLDKDVRDDAITPTHLRRCLTYLVKNHYTFISLEQLIVALRNKDELPPKCVVFTIDDGFLDQAEVIAPIFLEFACPPTFFVITGMLDQALWPWDAQISWVINSSRKSILKTQIDGYTVEFSLGSGDSRRQARRLIRNVLREIPAAQVPAEVRRVACLLEVEIPAHHPPVSYQPMNWDMARALERKGVRFAPHSVSHRIMSKLDKASMQQEILTSWESMQRELEDPLKVFCYPTGRLMDYGPREIDLLEHKGFLGAVSTIPELAHPAVHSTRELFSLPRIALPHSMNDFIQYCSWIGYAKQARNN